jgi:small subunit ribosomal protein S16
LYLYSLCGAEWRSIYDILYHKMDYIHIALFLQHVVAIDRRRLIAHNSLYYNMVKIRLRRVGAKNRPSYRLVVADSRAPRDGAFISIIGHYNPLTDPEEIVIDEEKALDWLKQGAQPTETVSRLLNKTGILDKFKTIKEKS